MSRPPEQDPTPGSAPNEEFESLLQRLLAAEPDARDVLLGELCEAHPAHASELRHCLSEYSVLSRLLGEPGDTGGSLAVVGGDLGQADAWDAFLKQLRARTGAWSRYLIEGEIARGGMGVIYRAIDRDARRRVALKVMRERSTRTGDAATPSVDPRTLGRFLEEAQVNAQLDHPGIAPVHEIGIDPGGRVYFTMKLVKGEDFQRIIQRIEAGQDGWTLGRGVSVLLRVCEAMSYAHAKGVLHRDLKPSNIMVGRYGEAYVMDWGLARVLGREDRRDLRIVPEASESVIHSERNEAAADAPDSPLHTMDGDVVGTPAYMSPEQAFGQIERMGPASDVYAIGAILYHLLGGRIPYLPEGARLSARAIHARVMQGPPEPITELCPEAPAELVAICEKAMGRDVGRRYRSMEEVATDLRAFLERRVVLAYETGLVAEFKKLVSRNRAAALAIAIALFATAGVTAVSMETLRRQRNEATALAEEKERERLRASSALDEVRLRELRTRAADCFPLAPERLPEIESWLEEARLLRGQLADYERVLADVVAGSPVGNDPRSDWAADLVRRAAGVEGEQALTLLAQAQAIETSIANYPFVASNAWLQARGGDVSPDKVRFWASRLQQLCEGIRALEHEGRTRHSIPGMERHRELVVRMGQQADSSREAWTAVLAELRVPREAERHGEPALSRMSDLVPLGRNPGTGLFEFWHVPSGERPVREPDSGRWLSDESTGIVFVLLPAAEVTLGSQTQDRTAPNWSASIHYNEEILTGRTRTFMIARTELTQGQWLRLSGRNPSYFSPGGKLGRGEIDLAYPVESLDADWAMEVLERFNLRLPFEFEWEHACRAGTATPWWFEVRSGDMDRFENLSPAGEEGSAEDVLGPEQVANRQPNAFGLYDMGGNVREVCGGAYGRSGLSRTKSGGFFIRSRRIPGRRGVTVPLRGGSYASGLDDARSSRRQSIRANMARCDVGFRPVRELPPAK